MPLRVFPVASVPGVAFSDDYGDARSGGRSHEGNDILAPEGTPLLAVDDGTVTFGIDPLGGNIANLRAADGTRYYYAHLASFAGGVAGGTRRAVRAGELVGTVGRTGNAAGAGIPPHVHFEVHPGGGAPVNPFPLLQRAERRAQSGGGGALTLLVLAGLAAGGYYWYARAGGQRVVRRLSRA